MMTPDDHPHQCDVNVEGPEDGVHPHHDLLGHGLDGGDAAPEPNEDPGVHNKDKLNKSVMDRLLF